LERTLNVAKQAEPRHFHLLGQLGGVPWRKEKEGADCSAPSGLLWVLADREGRCPYRQV